MKDRYPTDYGLWAVCAAALFVPTWLLLALATGLDPRHFPPSGRLLTEWACATLVVGAGAAAFGWVAQSVAVAQGGGFRNRPPDPQADDFEEPPAPG